MTAHRGINNSVYILKADPVGRYHLSSWAVVVRRVTFVDVVFVFSFVALIRRLVSLLDCVLLSTFIGVYCFSKLVRPLHSFVSISFLSYLLPRQQ